MLDLSSHRTPAHGEAARDLVAEALASGSGVRLRVCGGCMDPLLREGDWVWVVPAQRLLPGSIVLARSEGGNLVCHRLLRRVGAAYMLAGDRTLSLEEHPGEDVLGEVRHADRGGGRLLFEGTIWRGFGRLLVCWHLFSYGLAGGTCGTCGRLVEALRQRLVNVIHRVSWRLGGRTISEPRVS